MASSAIPSSPRAEAGLLERAAARLLKEPPPELCRLPEAVLSAQLDWVMHRAGEAAPGEVASAGVLMLRRVLVDELRALLVADCAVTPVGESELLRELQRLEGARLACRPAGEQASLTELADHGGLDLLVEVAHDVRSPLTSILFLSETLHKERSGPLNDVQKHQIGIIYSAALGLENMAADMIEAARGGLRVSARDAVPFSVNDVLAAILDLVRPMAVEKGLTIATHPLPAPLRVGQPVPLSRVLLNLCTNALKFTQQGSVELSARSLGGNAVEFAVADTGPGIAPEAVSSLYQPFRRAPTRASGYVFSGTGLGLAICRRLVGRLGSELQFDTDVSGTRFRFVLDLPPADFIEPLGSRIVA
ncbi:MAG: HAMP domain-containing histidine kinase [Gemmatimonadetes bacterium]|nr:HAMP domain-containing histidine kinase [Gemmatimonadota bacterium]